MKYNYVALALLVWIPILWRLSSRGRSNTKSRTVPSSITSATPIKTNQPVPSTRTSTSKHERIALCISGTTESFHRPVVHLNIRHHFLEALNGKYEVDVFFNINLQSIGNEEDPDTVQYKEQFEKVAQHHFQPVRIVYHRPEQEYVNLNLTSPHGYIAPNVTKCDSQLNNTSNENEETTKVTFPVNLVYMKQCMQIIETHEKEKGIKYDWVYRTTPNLILFHDIPSPDGLLNDTLYFNQDTSGYLGDFANYWEENMEFDSKSEALQPISNHILVAHKNIAKIVFNSFDVIYNCKIYNLPMNPVSHQILFKFSLLVNRVSFTDRPWEWYIVKEEDSEIDCRSISASLRGEGLQFDRVQRCEAYSKYLQLPNDKSNTIQFSSAQKSNQQHNINLNQKVAVCIAGGVRTFIHSKVHDSILKYVVYALNHSNYVDVFFNVDIDDDPPPRGEYERVESDREAFFKAAEKFQPVKIQVVRHNDLNGSSVKLNLRELFMYAPERCNSKREAHVLFPYTLYRMKQCMLLINSHEKQTNKTYDWIYRIRPDMAMLSNISLPPTLRKDTLYLNQAGPFPDTALIHWFSDFQPEDEANALLPICDNMAVSSRSLAEVAFYAFDIVYDCDIHELPVNPIPETLLKLWLLKTRIPFADRPWEWIVVRQNLSHILCDEWMQFFRGEGIRRQNRVERCQTWVRQFDQEQKGQQKQHVRELNHQRNNAQTLS